VRVALELPQRGLVAVLAGAVVEPPLRHQVRGPEQHQTAPRLPVTPGASGFLVVRLEAARRLEVDDHANVGIVDAHPERAGRDQDAGPAERKRRLRALAYVSGAPGMIVTHREPRRLERARHRLGLLARAAVHDPAAHARAPPEPG